MLFTKTSELAAFVSETSIFLDQLTLQQGGPADLASQLLNVAETMTSETIGLKFPAGKPLVLEAELGKKSVDFLMNGVPLYQEYLDRLNAVEAQWLDYRNNSFWPQEIEPSITAASILASHLAQQ
jgi:hypothetical protein